MTQDELLELIAQAAREGWTELDLSNQNLTELPPEIGHLTTLKKLDLGYSYNRWDEHNQLTILPPEIGQLSVLTSLNLSRNKLTALPPQMGQLSALQSLDLSWNQLTILPPEIGQLTALTSLDFSWNQLTTLPSEIGQLTSLTSLRLRGNTLTALPSQIGQLSALQLLDLKENALATLPPEICQLSALTFLDLTRNQLTTIPPQIGQLTSLTSLRLRGNTLTALPSQIGQLITLRFLDLKKNALATLPPEIGQLSALQSLNLSLNQLTTLPLEIGQLTTLTSLNLYNNFHFPLPPEILAQVDDAQAIIRAYLDSFAGQKRPLNEVKLVLVGEGNVGKTSLVNRLLYDTFDPNSGKTEGIAIHRWQIVNGESANERISETVTSNEQPVSRIRVNVWDFGGQEIMHATHQFFLTKRTLYVLVLDSRLNEAENRLDYWLTLIRSFGGDSPILIVGNKTDQHPLDLDRRGLLAKYPTVQTILDTSCATGAGIADLRSAIARQITAMPHIADPLVTAWFDVKAELEAMDADYIPYADYVRLCREKSVDHPDSQRALLGFLHDLGVVLHFPDPRLETTNILNPEWVTQGVYRILNTRLPFAEQGILTWDMLA